MIECVISTEMGRQRVTKTELARRIGGGRNSLARLYRNEAQQISFDVLSRLCAALQVGPGDILRYVPDEPDESETRKS